MRTLEALAEWHTSRIHAEKPAIVDVYTLNMHSDLHDMELVEVFTDGVFVQRDRGKAVFVMRHNIAAIAIGK